MDAVPTCKMSVYFNGLHGAIAHMAVIFILAISHYFFPCEHCISKQKTSNEVDDFNDLVAEFHMCRIILKLKGLNNLVAKWIITMTEFSISSIMAHGLVEMFYYHWW
jgi:hypothetical protein